MPMFATKVFHENSNTQAVEVYMEGVFDMFVQQEEIRGAEGEYDHRYL